MGCWRSAEPARGGKCGCRKGCDPFSTSCLARFWAGFLLLDRAGAELGRSGVAQPRRAPQQHKEGTVGCHMVAACDRLSQILMQAIDSLERARGFEPPTPTLA